jgi:hypothetical protein
MLPAADKPLSRQGVHQGSEAAAAGAGHPPATAALTSSSMPEARASLSTWSAEILGMVWVTVKVTVLLASGGAV